MEYTLLTHVNATNSPCWVGTVSAQCLNNLTLSRKVIDLLGNHLLLTNTTGARIFCAPISYMTEHFKLEKVHDLPLGRMRAGCSLSLCSTEVRLGVSLTLWAILGRDFLQITNLLVRVALRSLLSPSVYCRVTEVSQSSHSEHSSLGPILKSQLEMPLNTSV